MDISSTRLRLRLLFALASCSSSVSGVADDTTFGLFGRTQVIGGAVPSTRGQDFNHGWLFYRGDAEEDPVPREGITGFLLQAMTPEQNPEAWRPVALPHDWSVEDVESVTNDRGVGPFSRDSYGRDVAHTVGGVGWYRKAFLTQRLRADDRVLVHFDGVSTQTVVYANGVAMGSHGNAYTPFTVDITEVLEPDGEQNVIAVRVENRGYNSRWYRGSGVYRGVAVSVVPASALDAPAARVIARSIGDADGTATIDIRAGLTGGVDGDEVEAIVLDGATGQTVGDVRLASVGGNEFRAECRLAEPKLWSPETPHLYRAEFTLRRGGEPVDKLVVPFGVRSIEWSAGRGFLLNGVPTLLKGCNVHHDNGLLGAEAWRAADARRVRLLKESGFNAIRCSHNPPSASFLDACDRLGMMVIDEAFDVWRFPKRPADNHLRFADHWRDDLRATILRDRNRPSVIMWSIGNEVTERARAHGVKTAERLVAEVKRLDNTRPVTNGICDFWDNPDQTWADTAPAFAALDIGGYNYMAKAYESDHVEHPGRVMYASEAFRSQAHPNWQKVQDLPYVIGDFVWTGIDYLGEAGLGHSVYADEPAIGAYSRPWPWFISWCGDLDLIGDKKPSARYRDVLWDVSDLEVLVHEPIPDGKVEVVNYWGWPRERAHWSWPDAVGQPLQVNVYSKCTDVELRLDGRLLAPSDHQPAEAMTTRFFVPYRPGELVASGVTADGRHVTRSLRTVGEPARLALRVEPTIEAFDDGPRFVRVEVHDNEGRLVPTAEVEVAVDVRGAQLLAAGSASPTAMASFTQPRLTTFRGRGLVIVAPEADVGISVTAQGLEIAAMDF